MPTIADLIYVVMFAIALPLLDYLYFWPQFRRRVTVDPVRARRWFWAWAIFGAWPVVVAGAVLWSSNWWNSNQRQGWQFNHEIHEPHERIAVVLDCVFSCLSCISWLPITLAAH